MPRTNHTDFVPDVTNYSVEYEIEFNPVEEDEPDINLEEAPRRRVAAASIAGADWSIPVADVPSVPSAQTRTSGIIRTVIPRSVIMELNPSAHVLPQDILPLFKMIMGRWQERDIPEQIRHLFKTVEDRVEW